VIVVTTVRMTPASADPEYIWLKNERRRQNARTGRRAHMAAMTRVNAARRSVARGRWAGPMGAALLLAGGLWLLHNVGVPLSLPLACSLVVTLTGGVFIVRAVIDEAENGKREACIDRRDH